MTKKIIIIAVVAVLLVAILAFFAILAPGSRNDDGNTTNDTTTASSEGDQDPVGDGAQDTTTAFVESDLPDDLDFADQEISFLIWSDHTMNEFYVDGMSGDIIGDEIYERNLAVEDALNIKLTYTEEPGSADHMGTFKEKMQIDVNSGACEYDIVAGYSRTAPSMALDGSLLELTGMNYLDFSKPWWPEALITDCTVNDKLYFCSGDISTNLLWMMTATFFNKDLIAQYGLENPYDLVKNNQWTLDKMIEMTSDKYNDLDGAGEKDAGDVYGNVIYNINVDGFLTASGFVALEKNSDGEIIISPTVSTEKTYDLLDKLGEYLNGADVFFKNSTSVRDIFFEERAIFTSDRVFIVAGKDNGKQGKIEFEYGIVPLPKYDSAQDKFYTSVGHPYTMYAVSIGVDEKNIDGIAATIEMMASESYRRVTPAVFESAMKYKYASDDTASEMYDILRENVRFDLGRLYSTEIGDLYKTMRTVVFNNAKTFASQYKGISKLMNAGIEKISSGFADQ
ncbi:MAG: extracellular solute-binding protein [Clostridia bacterium]|nr:extracellular solute-binding protein [Clostridia bacterium]